MLSAADFFYYILIFLESLISGCDLEVAGKWPNSLQTTHAVLGTKLLLLNYDY